MNYAKLGRTGLDVSRICLGCMSYGGGSQGNHAWSLGEEESRPFIKPGDGVRLQYIYLWYIISRSAVVSRARIVMTMSGKTAIL